MPQQKVMVSNGLRYGFTVGSDKPVQLHKVQVARRIAGAVELLEGLHAQLPAAVQCAGLLNDGELVRVEASTQKFKQKRAAALMG